jgi:hypothetical protein
LRDKKLWYSSIDLPRKQLLSYTVLQIQGDIALRFFPSRAGGLLNIGFVEAISASIIQKREATNVSLDKVATRPG